MPTPLPSPLVGASITSCLGIAPGHPVFLITYQPAGAVAAQFVVKGEMPAGGNQGGKAINSLVGSFAMMRDAARGGRARVLTPAEAKGFLYLANTTVPNVATRAELANLATGFDQFAWLILGYKVGLTNLEGVINGANPLQAVQVLISLRDPENLDRLGRMLTVDLFLSNRDRFNLSAGGGITNAGNIFFVDKGNGDFKIKAMDPFDYTTSKSLLDTTIGGKYKDETDPAYWTGSLLKNRSSIERVARNALDGLWQELSGVLTQAAYPAHMIRPLRFTADDQKRVVASMEAALRDVKAFSKTRLSGLRGAGAATAGLKSRMKIMGWST